MESRRRPSATSTSTIQSQRESPAHFKSFRSPSVGSATPKLEDDDEGNPRRNTRHRNPLPPTSGPLFPPLPPKQPKNSPKNSPSGPAASRSPAVRPPSSQLMTELAASPSPESIDLPKLEIPVPALIPESTSTSTLPLDSSALEEDAVSARSVSPERPELPSASNASLTPPPPTSEDANPDWDGEEGGTGDGEEDVEAEAEDKDALTLATDPPRKAGPEEGDDWDNYRRHRSVRGFGAATVDVKTEPGTELQDEAEAQAPESGGEEDVDEEETPVKSRSRTRTKTDSLRVPRNKHANTPSAETNASQSERAGSTSRTRKRRGEDELLLDDHLLPVEIRRTSTAAKRDRTSGASKEEPEEEAPAEEAEEVEGAEDDGDNLGEDEEEEEEEEEEEVKDITRCVCGREDIDVMMIQCDDCNVWQHGDCMGIWGDEEAPDEYFCEMCKPERHRALFRYIERNATEFPFEAPTAHNLDQLRQFSDEYPPSQSKRWAKTYIDGPFGPLRRMSTTSRSHHKKEVSPAVEVNSGRRRRRGKPSPPPPPPPPPAAKSEKPPSVSRKQDSAVAKGRLATQERAHSSRLFGRSQRPRPTRSPTSLDRSSGSPQPSSDPPKKRSTMNSRDAAYEKEIQAAMEASKAEMDGPQDEAEAEADVEEAAVREEEKERGEKRRREDEEDVDKDRAKRGKRKKEEPEETAAATADADLTASGKPKHPNQYTYRPKPPSVTHVAQVSAVASPARRAGGGGTPVPVAPPAHHDHGTRRAGALAAAPVVYHPLTEESAGHLSWHLPDHLSAFGDLLPSENPNALEVPAPRVLSYLPRNHFFNQHYGPFSEERDENDKLVLPEEPKGREPVGDKSSQLDPPARPRFPVKRITTAEIKKRIRNVLEYVGRVQVEEGKRQERARLLGIDTKGVLNGPVGDTEGGEKNPETNGGAEQGGDITMAESEVIPEIITGSETREATTSTTLPEPTKSMQLMDEITRDLIAFQESLSSNGLASPIPPSISAFPSLTNGNGGGNGYTYGHGIGITSVPPTPTSLSESTVPAPLSIDVGKDDPAVGDAVPSASDVDVSTAEVTEAEADTGTGTETVEAEGSGPSTDASVAEEGESGTLAPAAVDAEAKGETAAERVEVGESVAPGEGLEVYKGGMVNRVITVEGELEAAEKVGEIVTAS